jgi:predicted nicotinamide N-methyase
LSSLKTSTHQFIFGNITIELCIPDATSIRNDYETTNNNNTPFPFWAKVWPASIGLCNFLAENIELIANKKVVEVAAGLGLPSLYAAHVAANVICSDYLQQPMDFVNKSIELNALKNITTTIIDWNHLPDNFRADVLLLSDINYDPVAFDALYLMLEKLIQNNTTIILATPQRLMAKSFIEKIEHWSVVNSTQLVNDSWISIFVLEG